MRENNFEKRVQETMEPFGFDPPDIVWSNIDQAIHSGKKDRRPLFWIFLCSGLIMLGGGYYFYPVIHKSPAIVPEIPAKAKKDQILPYTGTQPDQKKSNGERKENTIPSVTSNQLQAAQTIPGSNLSNGGGHALTDEEGQYQPKTSGKVPEKTVDWSRRAVAGSGAATIGRESIAGQPGQVVTGPDHQQVSTDTSLAISHHSTGTAKYPVPDSLTAKETTKKNTASKKKSSWTWGLLGSAGVSEINQGLFKSSNGNAAGYSSYPTANGSSGGSIVYSPSDITGGFSYSIGAFVKRFLSDRTYLSAGINYHYYSTGIQTGQQVDSALYLYSATSAAIQVPRYYQYGKKQSYTNQYHFIEIPLSAGFQLNKNKKNPLIWEAGLTLAFLTGSNALHFNTASGTYYQDNQQLNKTQLNAATSLMFGWPLKSGALQWGPQVEYGLTQISKSGGGSPEHLLFYGLKIYFFPGKK